MKSLKIFVLCVVFLHTMSFGQDREQSIIDSDLDSTFSKLSLFEKLYDLEGIPRFDINTDIKLLIHKKLSEEYQVASVQVFNQENIEVFNMDGRIRARGNYRKKVSYYPPVKIDFNKSSLDSLGLLKLDKLKIVLPAKSDKYHRELLYKEYLIYKVYEVIDPNALRTKMIDITITYKGKRRTQLAAFLIESEAEYEKRQNAKIIEREQFKSVFLERTPFLKMIFFQYMIANTDWSVGNLHNLEMVKLPKNNKVVAIPYDFDFSGFVGHHYTAPSAKLPINSVHERYFFSGYKISQEEFDQMVDYYLSIESRLYQLCDEAVYMKEKSRKECKKYLKSFFDLIRTETKIKYDIVKN